MMWNSHSAIEMKFQFILGLHLISVLGACHFHANAQHMIAMVTINNEFLQSTNECACFHGLMEPSKQTPVDGYCHVCQKSKLLLRNVFRCQKKILFTLRAKFFEKNEYVTVFFLFPGGISTAYNSNLFHLSLSLRWKLRFDARMSLKHAGVLLVQNWWNYFRFEELCRLFLKFFEACAS